MSLRLFLWSGALQCIWIGIYVLLKRVIYSYASLALLGSCMVLMRSRDFWPAHVTADAKGSSQRAALRLGDDPAFGRYAKMRRLGLPRRLIIDAIEVGLLPTRCIPAC